jgi:hypothetical protein
MQPECTQQILVQIKFLSGCPNAAQLCYEYIILVWKPKNKILAN